LQRGGGLYTKTEYILKSGSGEQNEDLLVLEKNLFDIVSETFYLYVKSTVKN